MVKLYPYKPTVSNNEGLQPKYFNAPHTTNGIPNEYVYTAAKANDKIIKS